MSVPAYRREELIEISADCCSRGRLVIGMQTLPTDAAPICGVVSFHTTEKDAPAAVLQLRTTQQSAPSEISAAVIRSRRGFSDGIPFGRGWG